MKLSYRLIISLSLFFASCRNNVDPNASEQSVTITATEGTNMSASLSPDGKFFAIGLQGTIWLLPSTGGEATAITGTMGDCHEPSWSPDGNEIAFHSYATGNYHIWIVNKDGSGLRQVTHGTSDNREPCWDPDGKSIVFSSDRQNNNYDIFRVDLASGNAVALTNDSLNEYNPCVSEDGRKVAFVTENNTPGITVLQDGKTSTVATPSGYNRLAAPSWSRDGSRIAFAAFDRSSRSDLIVTEIGSSQAPVIISGEDVFPFRVNWIDNDNIYYASDGGIQKRSLKDNSVSKIPMTAGFVLHRPAYERKKYNFDDRSDRPAKGIIGPDVSPDGKKVAFAALSDLYIQTIGGALEQITRDAYVEADPDWSPDGRYLAYVSDRAGTKSLSSDLWVYDTGTRNHRKLTIDSTGIVSKPSWSRDGKKIAFFFRDDQMPWGRWRLKVLDVPRGRVQIVYPSIFFPGKPTWSPRDNGIALMAMQPSSSRYREGFNKFLIVSPRGETSRFVAVDTVNDPGIRAANGPVWSPDGKQIAYTCGGTLWTVAVDDSGELKGKPVQRTTELAEKPSWTGDSRYIVYVSADRLKRIDLSNAATADIAVDLQWKPQASDSTYLIHAARLFNGVDSAYLTNVDVVIEGGRIRRISPHGAHGAMRVIDATDQVLMPGLIEGHTHQHISDGEPLGRIWLSNGITTLRETGADPYDALERKESWSAGARVGPRVFFAGPLTDGSRVYYGLSSSVADTTQLRLELERISRLDYDLVKTYVRMPDSMQARFIKGAHDLGIPVSSHEIYPAAANNSDAVEHLAGTSRRGYSQRQSGQLRIYNDAMSITTGSGMFVTPTVVMGGFLKMNKELPALRNNAQYRSFFSERYIDAWRKRAEASNYRLTEDYQKAVRALNANGRLTAGTDSPQVPYGTSLHAELWLFVQAGLSPFRALQTATLHAARNIGVDKDLGSVEEGKLADLILVSGDPLAHINDCWNVTTVIKDGIVYDAQSLLNK